MRKIQRRLLGYCWLIDALLLLAFMPEAGALPLISSQGSPNRAEVHSVVDFGREVFLQADFDGDHQPDLLTGRPVGGAYRIEIQFSSDSRLDTSRFLVSDRLCGIVVMALDVDGNNSLDLVVSDGFSIFPTAVWLGDGKGHFENGDPLHWLRSFAVGQGTTYRTGSLADGPALYGPTERLPLEKSSHVYSHVISLAG